MANLSRKLEAIFTITFVNLLPFHKFTMNAKLSRDSQVEYMLPQSKGCLACHLNYSLEG